MKSKIGAAGLLILMSALSRVITGCASPGPLAVKEASYPADKVDAHSLFVENCAVCHGENGRAHTFHGILVNAQNLTDAGWQMETTDEQIVRAIQMGPGLMPAFQKELSQPEVDALAKYVRSFRQTQ